MANSNSSTLGYLSSTQALADYATLITDLKNNLTAIDSPVVVFGGSYGGSKSIAILHLFSTFLISSSLLIFVFFFFFRSYLFI